MSPAEAMTSIRLDKFADFEQWRGHARQLLAAQIPPAQVTWVDDQCSGDLFGDATETPLLSEQPKSDNPAQTQRVPREFLTQAKQASHHSNPQRWALLYRLLWRLNHGERQLLRLHSDLDVQQLRQMASAVRRDAHKLEAFLRFREVTAEDGESWFIAWFEPEHYCLEYKADFLTRRFANMRFSVLTPYRSLHWNGQQLQYGEAAFKDQAPAADQLEAYWKTYYASIFNPARLKLKAMQSEMPKKYWKNLPEAELIKPLTQSSERRTQDMINAETTPSPLAPTKAPLESTVQRKHSAAK